MVKNISCVVQLETFGSRTLQPQFFLVIFLLSTRKKNPEFITTPKVYYDKNKIKRRSIFMERLHDVWPVLYWAIQRDLD